MASANPGQGFPQRMFAPQVATQQMATQQMTTQQPGPMTQQMSSPTKDVNTATLCRFGQEHVQDVVLKTTEMFNMLKALQLPNGVNTSIQAYQERKAKLEDLTRTLTLYFKKLRVIYDKVNESTTSLDQGPVERLLPIEDNGEVRVERPHQTETFKVVSEEHKDVVELLHRRNRQLKEIIDQLRTIIWDINTMMAMRRT